MSRRRMCGVVLWSNPDDQKAVVWCEDQGNLAYYVEPEQGTTPGVSLDAGDLIEFELREERQYRQVTNPTLLVQDHAPELARQLGTCANSDATTVPARNWASNVVMFPRSRDWKFRKAATHASA